MTMEGGRRDKYGSPYALGSHALAPSLCLAVFVSHRAVRDGVDDVYATCVGLE